MNSRFYLYQPPHWQRAAIVIACILFIAAVGAFRYRVGPALELGFIFLVPVVVTSWYVSWRAGAGMALYSVLVWVAADIGVDSEQRTLWTTLFNESTRLMTYLLTAFILARLRRAVRLEHQLARRDPLTRLYNQRALHDLGQRELDRCARTGEPCVLLYIDVDDFKTVNDTRGHAAGDALLREIAAALQRSTRRIDVAARIGGDEFCVLAVGLPRAQVGVFVEKLREALLRVAQAGRWAVRFSVGAAYFDKSPSRIESAIAKADQLMYRVKHAGKNNVAIEDCDAANTQS